MLIQMARARQMALRFRTWGGKRKNAGRKPNGSRTGVSHLRRESFERTCPVHVTLRTSDRVYNLRSRRCFAAIGSSIAAAAERFGVRIVQFSVMGNHVHLIVEAASSEALSRAMQGFSIRVAKRLNRVMKRSGKVLADRFHARTLRTPREVRAALAYVRDNARKHGLDSAARDPYASPNAGVALPLPASWLLRVGWRRARAGP